LHFVENGVNKPQIKEKRNLRNLPTLHPSSTHAHTSRKPAQPPATSPVNRAICGQKLPITPIIKNLSQKHEKTPRKTPCRLTKICGTAIMLSH
jgi:hypothetical protein